MHKEVLKFKHYLFTFFVDRISARCFHAFKECVENTVNNFLESNVLGAFQSSHAHPAP